MKLSVVLVFVGLAVCHAQFSGRDFFTNPGFNRRPSRPFNRRPSSNRNNNIRFPSGGTRSFNSAPRGGGGGAVHFSDNQNDYHYSWLNGERTLSGGGGVQSYCSRQGPGWQPVSIESSGKNSFIKGLLRKERLEYIWTGAVKRGRSFVWPTGGEVGRSFADWSHTGGNGSPQPDNRDRPEDCLAVLVNVYRDGTKWHDVKCSHTKPTVCERRKA